MTLLLFILLVVATAKFISTGRRFEPVVDAALPAFSCPVCEAPTAGADARCPGCGADADEEPFYRDGGVVLTPRRLVAGERVVPLELAPGAALSVAARGVPSGVTDCIGCVLLIAGTSALLAMLHSGTDRAVQLLVLAVMALLASPALLVLSYTETPDVEYAVRLSAGGGERELYASRDRGRVEALTAQLRQLLGQRGDSWR